MSWKIKQDKEKCEYKQDELYLSANGFLNRQNIEPPSGAIGRCQHPQNSSSEANGRCDKKVCPIRIDE